MAKILKGILLTRLRKTLFAIFVFLIPSQLALHLWPRWSYVFGIRIDYLSIAIYLTDIFLLILVLLYFPDFIKKNGIKINTKCLLIIIPVFSFLILNIFFSSVYQISLFRWLKFVIFSVFAFLISKDEGFNLENDFVRPLSLSIIFFTAIGIVQFIIGRTLGGIFYFLGERNFDLSTPGIALVNFFGNLKLRAYSTFSHPNSFAGYLLGFLPFLMLSFPKNKFDRYLKVISIFFLSLGILLSFSLNVYIAAIIMIILYHLIVTKKKYNFLFGRFWILFFCLISLIMPVAGNFLIGKGIKLPGNITDRLILSGIAIQEFSEKPLFGQGLGNFVSQIPKFNYSLTPFWFLQPVHNIFLLVLSETGAVGFILLFIFLNRVLLNLKRKDKVVVALSLLGILITGSFDHYWFTLQQNIIFLFLVLGLSFQ